MSSITITRARLLAAAAVCAAAAGGVGFGVARLATHDAPEAASSSAPQRKILYWYDPMIPAEHHDGPGLSSMGMKLIPRYADAGSVASTAPGITIDAASVQRLGARIVPVERGSLSNVVRVTGGIDFNERSVAAV